MEYLLAYAAGVLTLINPCVIPVLPIVVASALQASPRGPLALAAGMALSFVVLGVSVTAFGHLIGLDMDRLSQIGAALMIGFGLLILLPKAGTVLQTASAGFAAQADARIDTLDRGSLQGQFMGGVLLGAVWSPCIGPTLGGAIALASQGENLTHVTAIMSFFAAGVATLILGLSYGARGALQRITPALRAMAGRMRWIMGGAFVVVGTGLLLQWHHVIDAWLLDRMPAWLIDLSVSI